MLRPIYTLLIAAITALAVAAPAMGEPSWKAEGIPFTCTQNGETLGTATFSGGVGPNESPIAFVVSDASFASPHSIFVQAFIVVTVGGETFTTLDKPLPQHKSLITCTGSVILDNGLALTISATGFLTPAP
jgi:hypothetical protein